MIQITLFLKIFKTIFGDKYWIIFYSPALASHFIIAAQEGRLFEE